MFIFSGFILEASTAHICMAGFQRVFLATVEVLDPEKRTPRAPGQGFYFVSSLLFPYQLWMDVGSKEI
jgi:hypothetical protein